ncbi:hypothetical protein DRQ36_03610 [bacterium]|nr:MAG: hypothetical protein DRQ36_03610 [bacterium]RLJ05879.1 MAG: hypothetical protein DRP16_05710 [Candidatus Aenigmarchaeota archaeon]
MKLEKIAPLIFSTIVVFSACSEPVELGKPIPEARRIKIREITDTPSVYADDTVEVEGEIRGGAVYKIIDGNAELLLAPVGFDLPDSLIGGKASCQGLVFYHEERGEPGLAAYYIKVRPPRRRAGGS